MLSNETIMVIAAAIVVIAFMIVCFFLLRQSKEIRALKAVDRDVQKFQDKREAVVFERYTREMEINHILAGVLFDLAHATNPETIQWKLRMLRRVEMVMKATGYYNNYDDARDWLVNTLESAPPVKRKDALERLRNCVNGYYIMDIVPGENFMEILESLVSLQSLIENGELTAIDQSSFANKITEALKNVNLEVMLASMEDELPVRTKKEANYEKPASETSKPPVESKGETTGVSSTAVVQGKKETPKPPTPLVEKDPVMVVKTAK